MGFNRTKHLRLDKKGRLLVQSKHQVNGALIGTMLGDSTMHHYLIKKDSDLSWRKRSRIQFSMTHCEKQLDYLLWKESLIRAYIKFGKLIEDNSKIDKKYYKKTSLVASTKNLIYLYEKFYRGERKVVTTKLLNRLTPLGLALWFMDDGSLIPHSYKNGKIYALKLRLHTSNFNLFEHGIMKSWFSDKLNVDFNIGKDREYYILSTGKKESIINFIELIKPFVNLVPCMQYKINPYNEFLSANYPNKDNDIVSSA